MDPRLSVSDLPNEIVLQILLNIPTPSLLPYAVLSRRFHDLIARVLRLRLCAAASALNRHSILLESYTPSARLTEPRLDCMYIDTPMLEDAEHGDDSPGAQFKRLNNIYSRFRPYRHEDAKPRVWKHPAGDVPGTRTFTSTSGANVATMQQQQDQALARARADQVARNESAGPSSSSSPPPAVTYLDSIDDKDSVAVQLPPLVQQQIHLDSSELFTQLVVGITLKLGPPRGLFHRILTVCDGFVRVWRNWLADLNDKTASEAYGNPSAVTEPIMQPKPSQGIGAIAPNTNRKDAKDGILWLTGGENVGIKFHVYERKWPRRQNPILMRADEDLPVTYVIEYEELIIRTTMLMKVYEKHQYSKEEIHNKAIVWGVFTSS